MTAFLHVRTISIGVNITVFPMPEGVGASSSLRTTVASCFLGFDTPRDRSEFDADVQQVFSILMLGFCALDLGVRRLKNKAVDWPSWANIVPHLLSFISRYTETQSIPYWGLGKYPA